MSLKIFNVPTPPSTDDLFQQFREIYSKKDILDSVSEYQWKIGDSNAAKKERSSVAGKFQNWVRNGCSKDKAEYHADRVMKWGFNNCKSPKSLSCNTDKFCKLVSCWNKEENQKDMHDLLTKFLKLYGIGMARSSKWLCFVDERRFCIYDSRVSYALSRIKYNNRRVFPIIGGRSKNPSCPSPTPRKRERIRPMITLDI